MSNRADIRNPQLSAMLASESDRSDQSDRTDRTDLRQIRNPQSAIRNPATRAVLLVNLGSPDSASVEDVRAYLREFLMDGRVLDAAYPVRWCIVHLAILPSRPALSAAAYEKIWTAEGSPLVATSRKVRQALQERAGVRVELAMRYRNPSIPDAIRTVAGRRRPGAAPHPALSALCHVQL